MQLGALASIIGSYADAVDSASGAKPGGVLRELKQVLERAGKGTVAEFTKKSMLLQFPPQRDGGHKLADVVAPLGGLESFLLAISAKKELITAVKLILDVAREHSEVTIADFQEGVASSVASASNRKRAEGAAPVDQKLVTTYLNKLQAALGNDAAFNEVFRELSSNSRIMRIEAVELASRFLGPTPSSTSRPKALQRVFSRHQKLMESRAGSQSIGPRSRSSRSAA